MNAQLVILVAWFALGVLCVVGLLWHMKTHEKQLLDEIPEAQIFGCIPPPARWGALVISLFVGPVVLLWGLCNAIGEWRKAENEVPGGPLVAALRGPGYSQQRPILDAVAGAAGGNTWTRLDLQSESHEGLSDSIIPQAVRPREGRESVPAQLGKKLLLVSRCRLEASQRRGFVGARPSRLHG
jgi:hypothetical protein